ncbi:MAG: 16S rRNA (cytidine1402-2'-O)-methyltransferase [Acidimicrobiales bacterium]
MTAGRLLVIGTPIGNLGDLSPRGVAGLNAADAIACEDTRRTGVLLRHFGVGKKPLLIANEHTEQQRSIDIVERIAAGETVALVTDAGMPAISDPGRRVVRAAIEAGCSVEVLPGPTAVVAALVLSGLATDRFVFEGFLPRKGKERTIRLAEVINETRTVVIYESPKRVVATLHQLETAGLGDRQVAVARELTKLHEEVVRGTAVEVAHHFETAGVRGEMVLVVEGAPTETGPRSDEELLALLRPRLEAGSSTRDAVAAVVAETGEPKRRVYELGTKMGLNES